jgi:hypothetical protein
LLRTEFASTEQLLPAFDRVRIDGVTGLKT